MKSFLDTATWIVKGERPLKCEACGEPFTCGASLSGCWCGEIKLSDDTRAELRMKFKDCLCQRCLEKARQAASS